MLVRAKEVGYYELSRRKKGVEFELEHVKDFSFVWMEPVNLEDWALIREFDEWLKSTRRRPRYKPSDFYYPDIARGPENKERLINLAEAFELERHKQRVDKDSRQLELPLEEPEEEPSPIIAKKKIIKKKVVNRAADKKVI